MNEEELYLFDLQGYLIIENAIAPETLARMNAWLDVRAETDPHWQAQTGNTHIEHPLTWERIFSRSSTIPAYCPN